MDVRVQKEQTEAAAASKDCRTPSTIAVNFNILPDKAGWSSAYRRGYNERVIDPVTRSREGGHGAVHGRRADTNREKIRTEIKEC